MTTIKSHDGTVKEVHINPRKVKEFEAADPDWSILTALGKLEKMRYTDMEPLVQVLGFDSIEDYLEQGFTVGDIADAINNDESWGFSQSTAGEPTVTTDGSQALQTV